jgi:hypothetical protein
MDVRRGVLFSIVLVAASAYATGADSDVARGEGGFRGGEFNTPEERSFERGYNAGANNAANNAAGWSDSVTNPYYYNQAPGYYPPPQPAPNYYNPSYVPPSYYQPYQYQPTQQPMQASPYNPV